MSAIDRRAILKGGTATALATTVLPIQAAALPESDAALLSLAQQHDANWTRLADLRCLVHKAGETARTLYPRPPTALQEPLETPTGTYEPSHLLPDRLGGGRVWGTRALREWAEQKVWYEDAAAELQPVPEPLRQRAQELLALRLEYEAAIERIDEQTGLAAALAETNTLNERQQTLATSAYEIEAQSIAGVSAKLSIGTFQQLSNGGRVSDLLFSAMIDASGIAWLSDDPEEDA